MGQRTRGRLLSVGIVAAGVVGAGMFGALQTSGADPVPPVPPTYSDAGRIEIATLPDGTGTVAYFAPGASTATTTRSMALTKCKLTNTGRPGVGDVLTITPTGGDVGLVSNGLGVRTKNTCSTDTGRIKAGQALTFSLNGTGLAPNVKIDYARLDVEGKFGADLGYKLDGGPATVADLVNSSDNGPDAGASDNDNVTVGVAEGATATTRDDFRSVTLFPYMDLGDVSIEGGGDYPTAESQNSHHSILYLVSPSYDVPCGGTVSATFGTGTVSTATYIRGTDAFKSGTCVNIAVTLTLDSDGLTLQRTGIIDPTQELSGQMTIVWEVNRYKSVAGVKTLKTPAEINDELLREIRYAPTGSFVPVQWCTNNGSGGIGHPTATDPAGAAPWCLISDQQVLAGEYIVQTQVYNGEEDPTWK